MQDLKIKSKANPKITNVRKEIKAIIYKGVTYINNSKEP